MPLPLARLEYLRSVTRYPEMTPEETAIARAWVLKHAEEFDSINFNERVGTGLQLDASFDEATRRQAEIITQKRADIVAIAGTKVTIVEVKIRLAAGAMGQLLAYRVLWRAEHLETTEVKLVGIARDAMLDIESLFHAYGIGLELFPSAVLLIPR